MLALELDAALLHQLDHPPDIFLAAGDACADQAARRKHPDLLMVQHGGGVELLGERLGRERISTVEPFLTTVLGWTGLFNGPDNGVGLLLAGVILFVMVLPTMVAISRDVLAVVPNEQIEGALALGATRWQVLHKVVVPGARTGILGGFTLAMGRALGETVAVALVIGNSPYIAHSIKAPAATLASLIVNNFGEATGTELSALFGAGLVLLVIGVAVNATARVLVRSAARQGASSVAVA